MHRLGSEDDVLALCQREGTRKEITKDPSQSSSLLSSQGVVCEVQIWNYLHCAVGVRRAID